MKLIFVLAALAAIIVWAAALDNTTCRAVAALEETVWLARAATVADLTDAVFVAADDAKADIAAMAANFKDTVAEHITRQKWQSPPVARAVCAPRSCYWAACNGHLTWAGAVVIWGGMVVQLVMATWFFIYIGQVYVRNHHQQARIFDRQN